MSLLTPDQIDDLRELQDVCQELETEAVIIGATAFCLFMKDENRQTRDIDLAIAIELEDLSKLKEPLIACGWRLAERSSHQWRAKRGTWVDILPAGPSLRAQKKIVWPESGFIMSLVGFDHVFRDSVRVEVAPGFSFTVVPPPVLALLKIVSYLDDPHRRAKDLIDLQGLRRGYQQDTDRLFAEEVFQAKLSDIEFAGAFLLGLDVRRISTEEDRRLVDSLVARCATALDSSDVNYADVSREEREAIRFQQQLAAFVKGFCWQTDNR